MKKLTLSLMVSLLVNIAVAQDNFVDKMNEIKLSGDYYSAHSRAENEAAALDKCVKGIMAQLGSDQYDESEVRSKMEHLTKAGNPCRVFAYIRKNIIQPKKSESVNKKENSPQKIVFKKSDLFDEPSEASSPQPVAPLEPAPVIVEQPQHQPANKETQVVASSGYLLLDQLVTDIRSRATIGNAFNAFKAKKELGTVSDYGLLKNIPDMGSAYIVIYDAATDELSAILSPASAGCKNLLTGSPDSFSNYHGVKVFWFTLNNNQ